MAQTSPFIARNHFWPSYPHGPAGLSAHSATRMNSQVTPFGGAAPAGMGLPTAGGRGWLFQDKLIISTYLPTALNKADLEQKQRKKVLQMVLPLGSLQQGSGALLTFAGSPQRAAPQAQARTSQMGSTDG